MYPHLINNIESQIISKEITFSRKTYLQPFINFLKLNLKETNAVININFICTHNSRRSQLAQVWAQIAIAYFEIPGISCYSGGMEQTTVYTQITRTLANQGIEVIQLSAERNPIYALRYSDTSIPIILFSKVYFHSYNPQSEFISVMTCSQADEDCPLINGNSQKFSINYEDPKLYDGSNKEIEIYSNKSFEIASEMFYIFSKIK